MHPEICKHFIELTNFYVHVGFNVQMKIILGYNHKADIRMDYFMKQLLISCQIVKKEKPRKSPRAPPNSARKEVNG